MPPAAALQPFVVGYADLFVPLPQHQTYAARIVPLGCPAIVLFYEGQVRITDGPNAHELAPPAGFVGQITRSSGNEYTGTTRGFAVQLAPAGAYDLLRCEVHRYQNTTVPLHHALGAQLASGIARQLGPGMDFASRCAAADAFLLHHLAIQQATLGLGGRAAAMLVRSQGQLAVEEVARQLEVSVRTLLRHFSREVGLSPKTFARLVRFRAAHAYLQAPPRHLGRGRAALWLRGCGAFGARLPPLCRRSTPAIPNRAQQHGCPKRPVGLGRLPRCRPNLLPPGLVCGNNNGRPSVAARIYTVSLPLLS